MRADLRDSSKYVKSDFMDTTLTVTEAARNFADVVNRAYYRHVEFCGSYY